MTLPVPVSPRRNRISQRPYSRSFGTSSKAPKFILPGRRARREGDWGISEFLRLRKDLILVLDTENLEFDRGLSHVCNTESGFGNSNFRPERTVLVSTRGYYPTILDSLKDQSSQITPQIQSASCYRRKFSLHSYTCIVFLLVTPTNSQHPGNCRDAPLAHDLGCWSRIFLISNHFLLTRTTSGPCCGLQTTSSLRLRSACKVKVFRTS